MSPTPMLRPPRLARVVIVTGGRLALGLAGRTLLNLGSRASKTGIGRRIAKFLMDAHT